MDLNFFFKLQSRKCMHTKLDPTVKHASCHALKKGQLTFLTKNQDQNSLKLDSITPYKISLKSKKCELKQKFYNIAIKYIQK